MDIQEFLRARIAEDEAVANAAIDDDCGQDDGFGFDQLTGQGPLPMGPRMGDAAAHLVARSTPRRWLADCKAKRAIMDVATRWEHSYMDEDMWYSCPLAVAPGETEVGSGYSGDDGPVCRCGLEDRQLKLLLPLAAIYSDHPDYQQGWAA